MAYQIAKCTISGRSVTIFTDDDIVNNNSDSSKHFDNYGSGVSSYNSCIWIHSSGYKVFFIYALSATTFRVRYDDNNQDYTTTALGNLSGTLYGADRGVGSYNGCYIVWGSNAPTSLSDVRVPVFNDVNEATAYVSALAPIPAITSNGGGATHIAKVTGQLSSLSNNLSDILMVSGGGGGGLIIGEDTYAGKDAGGISGSGDNSADQSTGNAFGQGESADGVSGGGSGLYGGYKGTSSKSGGAGSGYIGNTLVSNKKMVGYNVPTSSTESTKTESVEDASENPVSGKPKIGNGYARIKFLRDFEPPEEYRQYIDNINGSGFDFIRNMDITTWNGRFNNVPMSYPSFNGLPSSYTWYTYANNGTDIPWDKSKFSYLTSALFCSEYGIDTVNIYLDDVDNKYKCILQKNNTQYYLNVAFPVAYSDDWISGDSSPQGALYGNFYTYSDYLSWTNCNPWYNNGWSTKTLSSNTLDGLFQILQKYVRNVDIYVDGVLWSKAGL